MDKSRQKVKRPQYTVPVGGFTSWQQATHKYNAGLHMKLKITDFRDPLHYWEWNVWYHEQLVEFSKGQLELFAMEWKPK